MLISSMLTFCLCAATNAGDEVGEAAPLQLKIVNNEDEPQIEIPEQKRNSPFKMVTRSRRVESNDKLIQLCQETVEVTSRRLLSTDQHTPWQMMHAFLGLRQDFQLLHNGAHVSGLDWVKQGQTFENEYWFEKTKFGGRAHPYSRPYAFEGHANQCVALLSMCGIELDQEFGTASGPITMRDMIKHAQMSVSSTDEPTWTLWALSRYLPSTAQWQNEKGEFWSIEKLVQSQTAKPMKGAPCGGTHGLFALAHARNVYLRQGKPLRGVWLQAEYKIRQHINTARMQTNSDGSLSSNYFRGRMYDPDFNKRMASIGHVLEFLMIALPQEELNSRWVRQAIETAANDLMNNRKAYVKCSPLYHTVNALNIYLDRVNPRAPGKVATSEETHTVEAQPRSKDATRTANSGIPATSISQARELPPATEEPAVAKSTENTAPEKTQATEGTPEAEQTPKEVGPVPTEETPAAVPEAAVPEPALAPPEPELLMAVPVVDASPVPTPTAAVPPTAATPLTPLTPLPTAQPEPLKQVPLLTLTHPKTESNTDDGQWKSTRRERQTALVVPEEKVVGGASHDTVALPTVNASAATTKAASAAPHAVNTAVVKPGSPQSIGRSDDGQTRIEPLIETDTLATAQGQTTLTVPADLPPTSLAPANNAVPMIAVSQPRLLDSATTATTQTEAAVRNSDIVPQEINEDFLDSDLDPKVWSARFEVESREIFASRAAIVKALNIKSGMTVADIGSGTGLFLESFAAEVSASGRVFAIDISPRLVDHLDHRVTAEKLHNVSVVRNDEKSLQLLMHRIDIAFVCDTYHHFTYHKEMLSSIFDSLLPGGELVLIDFDKVPVKSREWVMTHVRADKATFRSEVESAGFEFLEEVTIPGFNENYFLRFRRPKL